MNAVKLTRPRPRIQVLKAPTAAIGRDVALMMVVLALFAFTIQPICR